MTPEENAAAIPLDVTAELTITDPEERPQP